MKKWAVVVEGRNHRSVESTHWFRRLAEKRIKKLYKDSSSKPVGFGWTAHVELVRD